MLLRGGELDGTAHLRQGDRAAIHRAAHGHADQQERRDKGRALLRLGRGHELFGPARRRCFTKGEGFGHTGFTGTSLWVDPDTKTAVIVLTSRVHPDDKGNVTPLRREIGTIVARAVGK